MTNQMLYYIIGISGGLFILMIALYFVFKNKVNAGDMKRIKQLTQGTRKKKYSLDVIYQKLFN